VRYPRPPISLIAEDFPGWGVDIYIGGSKGVSDAALLAEHDIGMVINCAINLDIDWVTCRSRQRAHLSHGSGPVRYYKLGLSMATATPGDAARGVSADALGAAAADPG
jgi:myo-inositol-1(or 4)-monophosphatase